MAKKTASALMAAGRDDGFWERGLNAWDIAAGLLIVREAGGLIEPITQGADPLVDGEMICANDGLFTALAKAVRG